MRLFEVTRGELLQKTKNETPTRYAKRMNYVNDVKPLKPSEDLLKMFIERGVLTVVIPVHGTDTYQVTIHISGIISKVNKLLKQNNLVFPNRSIVYKAIREALDDSNILVDCTCPDFRYRMAYMSTKNDYKFGKPETRPANITNPHNNGAICKHLTATLIRPSQWIKRVDTWMTTALSRYINNELIKAGKKRGELLNDSELAKKIIQEIISGITDLPFEYSDDNPTREEVDDPNYTVDSEEPIDDEEEETSEEETSEDETEEDFEDEELAIDGGELEDLEEEEEEE